MTAPTEREALEALARRTWEWNECPAGVDPNEWVHRWVAFNKMLDLDCPEAYLAAALMLVPEGWGYMLWHSSSGHRSATVYTTDDDVTVDGATTALALCAAIERSAG